MVLKLLLLVMIIYYRPNAFWSLVDWWFWMQGWILSSLFFGLFLRQIGFLSMFCGVEPLDGWNYSRNLFHGMSATVFIGFGFNVYNCIRCQFNVPSYWVYYWMIQKKELLCVIIYFLQVRIYFLQVRSQFFPKWRTDIQKRGTMLYLLSFHFYICFV